MTTFSKISALLGSMVLMSGMLYAEISRPATPQVERFGKTIQTLGARVAFKDLFNGNPYFKGEQEYVKDLARHNEYLVISHGEIEDFRSSGDPVLFHSGCDLGYVSEHDQGLIRWYFQYIDADSSWWLFDLYFEKEP